MAARTQRQREWAQLTALAFHDPSKIESTTRPAPPRPRGRWWGGRHAAGD